jgi:hypothetical protein
MSLLTNTVKSRQSERDELESLYASWVKQGNAPEVPTKKPTNTLPNMRQQNAASWLNTRGK